MTVKELTGILSDVGVQFPRRKQKVFAEFRKILEDDEVYQELLERRLKAEAELDDHIAVLIEIFLEVTEQSFQLSPVKKSLPFTNSP